MPAPQPEQIHVLVVISRQIISISRNSKTAKTMERYETLSKTLARQEQVESLWKAIRTNLEGNFRLHHLSFWKARLAWERRKWPSTWTPLDNLMFIYNV
ncbi:hypothetical protein CCR75_004457 [Bremia lactucae]|uniref:Uncharacterized protein n=1 Tax=Bremia lactucae TaxID=4779 RepID=A0A976IIF0_BRELC|nr:hypothetical protein CCR75_004457 [Bremia lactucae]